MRSLHRHIAALFVATVVMGLVAVPGAEAKKKKPKKDAELTGMVLSMSDQPLAGVTVSVEGTTESESPETATTDESGAFSIKLVAAEYLVRMAKDGFEPFETTLTLPTGQSQNIRVQLLDASAGQRNVAIRAYNAGVEAWEAKDLANAKSHLMEAIATDASLTEPVILLAEVQFALGEYDGSAQTAERYLAIKPGDKNAEMLAYDSYLKSGNQAKVDAWRTRLAKSGAGAGMAIEAFNEGARATQAGDIAKAVDRFEFALGLNPDLAEAHAALGSIHYNDSKFDKALAAVERAIALKPDHLTSNRVRFLIHDARGDQAAAMAAIGTYAALDRKGAVELLLKRADLDFREGRADSAKAALLKAIEFEPERPQAHYTLGLIYASTDTTKAREHLERFIALAPSAPEAATARELMTKF